MSARAVEEEGGEGEDRSEAGGGEEEGGDAEASGGPCFGNIWPESDGAGEKERQRGEAGEDDDGGGPGD